MSGDRIEFSSPDLERIRMYSSEPKVLAGSNTTEGRSTPAASAAPALRRSLDRAAQIATYREVPRIRRAVSSSTYTPRAEFLAFSPPLIGEEEIDEVVDTLRSDWL